MEQPLELQDLEDKEEQLLKLEDREENFPLLGKEEVLLRQGLPLGKAILPLYQPQLLGDRGLGCLHRDRGWWGNQVE